VVIFNLGRPMPDIAQTSAGLVSQPGTAAAFTGSACPPIVSTFTAQSLGHWRSTMVTLSEDKSTNASASRANCTA
jgi:hypothetical protein